MVTSLLSVNWRGTEWLYKVNVRSFVQKTLLLNPLVFILIICYKSTTQRDCTCTCDFPTTKLPTTHSILFFLTFVHILFFPDYGAFRSRTFLFRHLEWRRKEELHFPRIVELSHSHCFPSVAIYVRILNHVTHSIFKLPDAEFLRSQGEGTEIHFCQFKWPLSSEQNKCFGVWKFSCLHVQYVFFCFFSLIL